MLKKITLFFIPSCKNNYRPQILDGRFLTYFIVFLVFLKFIGFSYFLIIPNTAFFADISSSVLINMVNEDREELGLSQLSENSLLTQAASLKAQDMIQKNYFSHWSPGGISPWHWIKEAGYNYKYAGENLAMGFIDASEVHQAWLNSPTHKENLLNSKYSEIGIAVARGTIEGRDVYLVVQMFGTKQPSFSQIIPTEENTSEARSTPNTQQGENQFTSEIIEVTDESLSELELVTEGKKITLGDYDEKIWFEFPRFKRINDFKLGVFKFLMTKYDSLIQKIAIVVFSFLVFVLFVNVFIRFDVRHPDLIIKGIFLLIVLILFNYFDQETIMSLIGGKLVIS